jgi:hypothetical protein
MGLQLSDSKIGVESLYSVFDDLGSLILKGLYSKVDISTYLSNIYLSFLDKIMQASQNFARESSSMLDLT